MNSLTKNKIKAALVAFCTVAIIACAGIAAYLHDSESIDNSFSFKNEATAFAVYSEDDNSLNFYKRTSVPSAGEQFEGKTATSVYTGFETTSYTSSTIPWVSVSSLVVESLVVDEGIQPTSLAYWFSGFQNMKSCSLNKLNTSSVASMSNMFRNCSSLTTLDLSNWDTSSVTNLSYMLRDCSSLTTLDLSSWDTSSVTNMSNMFYNCSKLEKLDLSHFETSSVSNMSYMFQSCTSLVTLDLSSWDTSSVTNINYMFSSCRSLVTIYTSVDADWSFIKSNSGSFNLCTKLIGGNGTKVKAIDGSCARVDGLDEQAGYFTPKIVVSYYDPTDNSYSTPKQYVYGITANDSELENFLGWSTSSTATEPDFKPGDLITYDPEHIQNLVLYPVCREPKQVSVEWHVVPPSSNGNIEHNAQFNVTRISWNNTTAELQAGGSTTILNAYSVGNDGTTDNLDTYIFLSTEKTEQEYQDLLIGSYLNVTNSPVLPAQVGLVYNIAIDKASTEAPTKVVNGKTLTYKKYRVTVKTPVTTTIWDTQLSDLKSVQPVTPFFKGWVQTGWTEPQLIGENLYKVSCTWQERVEEAPDENSSYAAIYGGNTLVFGRGIAPATYNGLALSSDSGMDLAWYGLEQEVYAREDVPWSSHASAITTATVKDPIAPLSTAYWFSGMRAMTSLDLDKLDGSKIADMNSMFSDCSEIVSVDLSKLDLSSVTCLNNLFYECNKLTSVAFPNTFSSALRECAQVFYSCDSLTSADLSMIDTSGVTSFRRMFYYCKSLSKVNLGFSVESGKVFSSMFESCTALQSLDLSNWDPIAATDMDSMFSRCTSLQVIFSKADADWSSVSSSVDMFLSCISLVGGNDTGYNSADCSASYARVDGLGNQPGYFTVVGSVRVTSFAVYSADDNSLSFYDRAEIPSQGDIFNGKTATQIYRGVRNSGATPSWKSIGSSVISVSIVDSGIQPATLSNWFSGFSNLETITGLDKLDTSKAQNMISTFENCSQLTLLDLSSWDTSSVVNMYHMFTSCESLVSIDGIANWNTAQVTNMSSMFTNCSSLATLDLSNWDVSKVSIFSSAFSGCTSLTTIGDLSSWDTSSATTMHGMFLSCAKLSSLGDLSGWDTSSVTNMGNMFSCCYILTTPGDLSAWNTSNVTRMFDMFSNCDSLTTIGDLSSWNTSKVINMTQMFENCSKLASIGDLSNWNTSNATSMHMMFSGCTALTTLNLSSWDTSNVADMYGMFAKCSKLTSLGDMSNWNTSSVTTMYAMFQECTALTSLDLSGWDTSNVINMQQMFANCSSLTTLDLSGWDTSKVAESSFMFLDDQSLSTVYAGDKFEIASSATSNNMFGRCYKITGGNGTKYSSSNIDGDYARVDGLAGKPGYFTAKAARIASPSVQTHQSSVASESGCVLADALPPSLSSDLAILSFEPNTGAGEMADLHLDRDTEISLPACLFVKKGYEFVGWNTKPDGSGISLDDKQLLAESDLEGITELVLYAQWQPIEPILPADQPSSSAS